MHVSSAYRFEAVSVKACGRSLICIKKRSGPRIEPWGSFKNYVRSKLPVFEHPLPPCSFLFILDVPPPPPTSSMYVRFSELPPSQKMFCDAYDAYFE